MSFAFAIIVMFALYFWLSQQPRGARRRKFSIGAVVLLLLCVPTTSTAVNVLDSVNRQRMAMGLYPLLPDAGLQAAAEESSRRQAARRRMGHTGTMPMGTAEGVGHGRLAPFRFKTCFHRPSDYTRKHRYAGAAIVGGYATLSLDADRNRGAIGSGRSGSHTGSRRRGLFRRR